MLPFRPVLLLNQTMIFCHNFGTLLQDPQGRSSPVRAIGLPLWSFHGRFVPWWVSAEKDQSQD